jgi:phosphoserine aminotransferase
LPAGLQLAANGTISGTPTAQGSFTFTVTVTDASSKPASRELSLTVK